MNGANLGSRSPALRVGGQPKSPGLFSHRVRADVGQRNRSDSVVCHDERIASMLAYVDRYNWSSCGNTSQFIGRWRQLETAKTTEPSNAGDKTLLLRSKLPSSVHVVARSRAGIGIPTKLSSIA